MNLASKTFKNNRTGESVKVIDSFENIAVLENKQKIDVRTLMDPNQYTEQIDPSSFFNNQNAYNSLAEKIKNIPTEGILDDSTQLNFGSELNPTTNESAIIMTSEEDEMAELARKYGATLDNGDSVAKQQQAFAKLLGEEEPVTKIEVNNVQQVEMGKEYIQGDMTGHRNPTPPPIQRVEVEDPIITMFRRTKRNVNFNINIEVSDKIPRLDFIEMMEDSYEISMIDFLADEFTNKILQDPSSIRNSIKEKIKQLVYGGGQKTNTEVEKNNKEDKNTNSLQQKKENQITDAVTTEDKPKRGRKAKVVEKTNSEND